MIQTYDRSLEELKLSRLRPPVKITKPMGWLETIAILAIIAVVIFTLVKIVIFFINKIFGG